MTSVIADRWKKRDSFLVHEINIYKKDVSFYALLFFCLAFVQSLIVKSNFFFFFLQNAC